MLSGFLLIAPVSFAVLWFPNNEIERAISVKFINTRLGLLLAFLIPSHNLFPLSCNNEIRNLNSSANSSFINCKKAWINQQKRNLLIYQGSLTFLALVILLVLIFLAADQPPKPRTKAQALLRRENESVKQLTFTQHTKVYVKEMKLLFSDFTFANIIFSLSILYTTNIFQNLFISELMRPIFGGYFHSNPDEISSYLIILYQIGAIVGSIISGQVMNRMKNYVLLVRIGYLLTIACTVGFILSYYFKHIPFIFISNAMIGLCASCIYGPIFEISTQHTYPRPTDFVLSCLIFALRPFMVVLSELYRLVFVYFGGFGLLVIYVLSYVLGFLLSVFLRPKYRRLETESNSAPDDLDDQTQPLLISNENNKPFDK